MHTCPFLCLKSENSCLDSGLLVMLYYVIVNRVEIYVHLFQRASTAKSRFSAKDYSDHMALVRAYEGWKEAEREGSAYEYCWKNFLSAQTLQAIHSLRNQFNYILKDAQLLEAETGINNRLSHNQSLVRAIICAGLFPGIASVVVCFFNLQYYWL